MLGQLRGLHSEVAQLAKKAPNDAVNAFKLRLINKVIEAGNAVLVQAYRPFLEFEKFEIDDVPTNSDVTLILNQYMEQAERYRSDNVVWKDGSWKYMLDGVASNVKAAAPSLLGSKK